MEQRVQGTLQIWAEPFVDAARARSSSTCAPTRSSAPTSRRTRTTTGCSTTTTSSWPRTAHRRASSWQTFEEFPPRQKAASFTIDQVVEKLESRHSRSGRLTPRLPGTTGAARTAILELRRPRHEEGGAGLRAARRAHRRVRQRRHAVVREARRTSRRCSSSRACASRPRRTRAGRAAGGARRCCAATSRARSSTGWRRSPACCSSTHAGWTTEEFTARRRGVARRGAAPALRRAVRAS